MRTKSLVVAGLAMALAALVLLVPLNSRFDTVKPCGEELACSVPRYKSLFLSAVDLEEPFNGLNRVTVPVLSLVAVALGAGAGSVAESRAHSSGAQDR